MNSDMLHSLVTTFSAACSNQSTFFGLRPWYYYLKPRVEQGVCIVDFDPLPSSGRSDFLLVLLVVIDDLLRIAGLVAIGFIIYAGVLYMTSQGQPEQTQKAQQTIQNAIIGLVFCVLSVALIGWIAGRF